MLLTTVVIFENVSTFSSVKTRNMGIIDTQKHRKKIIGQTCVCLCCDDLYLRILGVFFFKKWYRFYKGDLATKMQI